jgi:hypothetical protein
MPANNLFISNSDKRPVTASLLVKKLWPLVVFVVLFVLGTDYICHEYLVFHDSWSNQSKVKRLIENENPNEISVFGASLARSSFMPDSISPDVYNYGMGKALFDVTRVLMKIECEKDKDAPIIFEINPRTFIKNPQSTINSSTFIPTINYPRIEEFLRESNMFHWHYKVPGLRYYGNYFEYLNGPLRRKSGKKKDNRGAMIETRKIRPGEVENFVQRLENVKEKRQELVEKMADTLKSFTPVDTYVMRNLDAMIYFSVDSAYQVEIEGYFTENRHRKFVLVTVPGNPLLIKALPNFEAFGSFITALAEKHPNVYYLDYSDMPTTPEDFKDPTHFSAAGSRKFSGVFQDDFERITGITKEGNKTLN